MSKTACSYCGDLDWTVEKYGRVTHKEGCPMRRDPWHQGNPTVDVSLRERAAELKVLPPNWDSYEGVTPDAETVDKAVEIALALTDLGKAQLVPGSDGSVQVEWHEKGWDVEIWIQRVTS